MVLIAFDLVEYIWFRIIMVIEFLLDSRKELGLMRLFAYFVCDAVNCVPLMLVSLQCHSKEISKCREIGKLIHY